MFSVKEFFQSPQHFHSRDEPPSAIEDLGERWHIGVSTYFREVIDRQGRPFIDIFHAKRESDEPLLRHAVEGIEFVELMDKAERASNGLRSSIRWENKDLKKSSKFGTLLTQAFNDPSLSDHNHEHNRRTERFMEAMLLNIGVLRHKHTVRDWIDSMMLYSYWHDVDQLISLYENTYENKDISVKKGHAIAGSVMMLALHKRYGEERRVRNRRAWEICAGSAYMMMRHDEPERFMYVIGAKGDAQEPQYQSTESLYDAFTHDAIDLTTLSPRQMTAILKHQKDQSGYFVQYPNSQYGLHPLFEQEYTDELSELQNNSVPLFRDFDERSRSSLTLATEVSVRADLMEMIAPPYEEIIRKLLTQYSYHRPFFRVPKENKEASSFDHTQAFIDDIIHGPGNIQKETDSDVRRLLWELVNGELISKDTPIAQSRYIKTLMKDMSVMGVMLLKTIGKEIMTGNTRMIDHIYSIRKEKIYSKALRKSGVNRFEVWALKRQSRVEDIFQKNAELFHAFQSKMLALDTEKARLFDAVYCKDENGRRASAHIYPHDEVLYFEHICDQILKHLQERYRLSTKDMLHYDRKVKRGRFPQMPYRSYDSLGGIPRTFVEPIRSHEYDQNLNVL